MKNIGVYIHIPFCKQKCYYCDFISFANKEEMQQKYIQALIKEINNYFKQKQDIQIETLYIGGGTPSYIDASYIKESMQILNEKKGRKSISVEKTIEVNPGTVNKEKLQIYKDSGINRLSIGLQSTSDRLLKQIGRIHNYNDFLNTYNLAKEVGFKNINVDLMIDLPNQTIEDIKESLKKVLELNPAHISVYSLIIESGTQIDKMILQNKIKLPEEELERNMYWYVKNYLELNGYNHYEISNFAKPGFEAKHNLDCWNQKEYMRFWTKFTLLYR